MDDFTITIRLTKKDYVKVVLIRLYQRPAFIVTTLVGLYLLTTVTLDYFNMIDLYSETPWFEIVCGLFILSGPLLILLIAYRQFISNPNLQNDTTFTFGESGIAIQGLTFKGEFMWAHILKQKEVSKFLILYHTKNAGNFIDKTKLTPEQIRFIKSKVGEK